MTAREAILARVRANRPGGQHDLPTLPRFPVGADTGTTEAFARALKQMGGKLLEHGPDETPLDVLRRHVADAGIVASVVPEVTGTRDLAVVTHPANLADVDLAVVRAAFGVAETGSVLFTEAELQVNAVSYLAQHLIVLLDPADIVASTQDAYQRRAFHSARYAVFHTGPSATADIEGVLVHGAQGVRSLTVALVPRGRSQ